jgi:hypothetical protein
MMPALVPGGTFFFDPGLDPVWAACVDVDLPISQHGGSGAPTYGPPGFAAIMTLALEHSFYSGRSLWQLILGGVFERFPDLRVAFVETEADWIAPAIRKLDRRLAWGDDWTGWAKVLQRQRTFSRPAREYWAANCSSGISPFTIDQVPLGELARPSAEYDDFAIGCDNAMFGVDYPHFESIFPGTSEHVDNLIGDPHITTEVARKILCENAARVGSPGPAPLGFARGPLGCGWSGSDRNRVRRRHAADRRRNHRGGGFTFDRTGGRFRRQVRHPDPVRRLRSAGRRSGCGCRVRRHSSLAP